VLSRRTQPHQLIVTDGESLVRLEPHSQSQSPEADDEAVQNGSSGRRRRHKRLKRRNSSHRAGDGIAGSSRTTEGQEEEDGRNEEEGGDRQQQQGSKRKKWAWWKRKKVKVWRVARGKEGQARNRRQQRNSFRKRPYSYISVESSPGRNSPSPDTLRMILNMRNTPPSSPEYFPPSPNFIQISPHFVCSDLLRDLLEEVEESMA